MRRLLLLLLIHITLVACTKPTALPSSPPTTVVVTETVVPSVTQPAARTPAPSITPTPKSSATAQPTALPDLSVQEYPVQMLPLGAPLDEADAEISGMAWYSDTLILLPQFPERYEDQLFGLPRANIVAHLENETATPLIPLPIAFDDGNLHNSIRGFEGYEAIAFVGNQIFVTIEVRLTATTMTGYLVMGEVIEQQSVRLNPNTLTELPAPAPLENYSDEAMTVWGDSLYTFYEANGATVNPGAMAHSFDLTTLAPQSSLALVPLEYRLTDATPADEAGNFWVINYLFPGDIPKLQPATDEFAEIYGLGDSHRRDLGVERLIQYQIHDSGIEPADTPPLYLRLEPGTPRNWEGIAILEGHGFLLATDKFPSTLLGFVAYP